MSVNSSAQSRVVVVTGDVTMDWNVTRGQRPERGDARWNDDDRTRTSWQRGGAALLADLVAAAAARLERQGRGRFDIRQTAAPTAAINPCDYQYPHSFAIWSRFDRDAKAAREERPPQVWRVEKFLGVGGRVEPGKGQAGRGSAADWRRVVDDPEEADIVVLDDAGLGFRDDPELWPRAVRGEGCRPWVVAKMTQPVARGKLWQELHARCPGRLVVVMTANDLRLTAAQISRELSWERTAQELAWALVHNPAVNDLSKCAHVVVSFDGAGALLMSRPPAGGDPPLEATLFFDPAFIEGTWADDSFGGMIGYTTCLTAAVVRRLMLAPDEPDIKGGVQDGVAAMRRLHREGYGEGDKRPEEVGVTFPHARVAEEFDADPPLATARVPAHVFLPAPATWTGRAQQFDWWTILEEHFKSHAGQQRAAGESVRRVAEDIVRAGVEDALKNVPLGKFNDLLTVDRQEIENFRNIRALVKEYFSPAQQKRPLSVAVFGAPGSGKSFGIVEVGKSLMPGQVEVKEFNLSQFNDPSELIQAFHQVRDISLSGKIPFIFWDEFDTKLGERRLGWLRYFLSPMQDGRFQHGQITHPIGRAVFVFAGGTHKTMGGFDEGHDDEFRNAKGPDFVSRLKGYVNIMGPDRQSSGKAEPASTVDPYFIVRRAVLLRSTLLRNAAHLFDEKKVLKEDAIDDGVLRAFLKTKEYKHGSRSMENIVAMSRLTGKDRFERSSLPAESQLTLHVDAEDFLSLIHQPELESVIEDLAVATHEYYRKGLKPTHSSNKSFAELLDGEQESNRGFAREIPRKLASIGYTIIRARGGERRFAFKKGEVERLAEKEHHRWLKEKSASGQAWCYGAKTDKQNFRHDCLRTWRAMPPSEKEQNYPGLKLARGALPKKLKENNRRMIRALPAIVAGAGYHIVRSV